VPDGIDPVRPVAVLCTSGQRAGVAASLVRRYGGEQVVHVVDGGIPTWRRLGHPLTERQLPPGPPRQSPPPDPT
jgi:rhodanese-related sulfurtransferase